MLYNIKVIISSLFIALGVLFFLYYLSIDLYIDLRVDTFVNGSMFKLNFINHIPEMVLILLLIPTCYLVKGLIKP